MKWQISAKTFLLGEYAALNGESALLLTTSPCFTLTLSKEIQSPDIIHKDSPAGRWWNQNKIDAFHLQWHDPYQGRGGLGASSAQFIGAYYASAALNQLSLEPDSILEAYYQSAWTGEGIKPSGYDILAQLQPAGLGVYINKNQQMLNAIPWSFSDIAFILLHTGKKLATHKHLACANMPKNSKHLSRLAEKGFLAFQNKDAEGLIAAINDCYQELQGLELVATHTQQCIANLKQHPAFLAIKGCGALGADVIITLLRTEDLNDAIKDLYKDGYHILATSQPNHTGF